MQGSFAIANTPSRTSFASSNIRLSSFCCLDGPGGRPLALPLTPFGKRPSGLIATIEEKFSLGFVSQVTPVIPLYSSKAEGIGCVRLKAL